MNNDLTIMPMYGTYRPISKEEKRIINYSKRQLTIVNKQIKSFEALIDKKNLNPKSLEFKMEINNINMLHHDDYTLFIRKAKNFQKLYEKNLTNTSCAFQDEINKAEVKLETRKKDLKLLEKKLNKKLDQILESSEPSEKRKNENI